MRQSIYIIEQCLTLITNLGPFSNINYFGSFNRPHAHEGTTLSGVYYIDVHKNSGNIIFHVFLSKFSLTKKTWGCFHPFKNNRSEVWWYKSELKQ